MIVILSIPKMIVILSERSESKDPLFPLVPTHFAGTPLYLAASARNSANDFKRESGTSSAPT